MDRLKDTLRYLAWWWVMCLVCVLALMARVWVNSGLRYLW